MSTIAEIYGIKVPEKAYIIGFRGIVQGNRIDILPDRRVKMNITPEVNKSAYFKEFVGWVQNEFDTHVDNQAGSLEENKIHTHSFGGNCEARWRKAGGYLYFLAWREPNGK